MIRYCPLFVVIAMAGCLTSPESTEPVDYVIRINDNPGAGPEIQWSDLPNSTGRDYLANAIARTLTDDATGAVFHVTLDQWNACLQAMRLAGLGEPLRSANLVLSNRTVSLQFLPSEI